MTGLRRTGATNYWIEVPWNELPGDFTTPIYFKVHETDTIGQVKLQLRQGRKTKTIVIHSLDPTGAMDQLVKVAKEWDTDLSSRYKV